jgi:hypothetical protein
LKARGAEHEIHQKENIQEGIKKYFEYKQAIVCNVEYVQKKISAVIFSIKDDICGYSCSQ